MKSNARFLLLLGSILLPNAAAAGQINMLTEHYPPFSYREGDEIKGLSVDLVDAVMKEAGLPYAVDLLPWARAYSLALTQADTCVFITVHTPERDALFKWVEPVVTARTYLVRKAGTDVKAATLEEARAYTVGTQRNDFTEQLLKKNKFEKIDLAPDIELTTRKLLLGRIDLMPMSERSIALFNKDERKVEKVVELGRSVYSIACNKAMSDEEIGQMQKSLETLQRNGTLRAIHARYGIEDVTN